MDYKQHWEIIEKIGEGGQGKVYRVLDKRNFDISSSLVPKLGKAIEVLNKGGSTGDYARTRKYFDNFREVIRDMHSIDEPSNHGALKVLHEQKDARDPIRANERIQTEIAAMSELDHPNLLKILDFDSEGKWFVSEFHPQGTLQDNKHLFTGDLILALKAFRPLVEGVAKLHIRGLIHRDIKPQNIFIDANGNLVLGDFGIVFFDDPAHTRLSDTFENVGSRDWMPPWAYSVRIENVNPTFDVFSLGKVFWFMISNKPVLPLWYFKDKGYNLEGIFPNDTRMKIANSLLEKCIVQYEKDCLEYARDLLEEIDKALGILQANADVIGTDIERNCKVCGIGKYRLIIDQDPTDLRNFGIKAVSGSDFKIFTCENCGHVQLFHVRDNKLPPAWKN